MVRFWICSPMIISLSFLSVTEVSTQLYISEPREINRVACKLTRTPTVIKKTIYNYLFFYKLYLDHVICYYSETITYNSCTPSPPSILSLLPPSQTIVFVPHVTTTFYQKSSQTGKRKKNHHHKSPFWKIKKEEIRQHWANAYK